MKAKNFLRQLRNVFSKAKEWLALFKMRQTGDGDYFLKHDIPFHSQWESKNVVDALLAGKFSAKQDSRWRESGAYNIAEYEMYSWQTCGLACLKMIVKSVNPKKVFRIAEVAREAEKYGVYVRNNNHDVRFNLDGMFHKPFSGFIKRFGLKGKSMSKVGTNYLASLLKNDKFIIASVHGSIREENPKDNPKKGHLILLIGFKVSNGKVAGFYINNSSGYYGKTQERYFVELNKWERCFSGNIITVEQC